MLIVGYLVQISILGTIGIIVVIIGLVFLVHSGHCPGWSASSNNQSPHYANPCGPTILDKTLAVLLARFGSGGVERPLLPPLRFIPRLALGKAAQDNNSCGLSSYD